MQYTREAEHANVVTSKNMQMLLWLHGTYKAYTYFTRLARVNTNLQKV
jgi:hypothetical protein